MIYLAHKGMSLTQLGLLETIFHITSFTMEVPTGAIADLFSRRLSRILGRVFSLASVILLLLSSSFWGFAFSFVLTAISYNLESGAGEALIYDSLKEIGDEASYMRINGNKEVFYQIASTVSFLVGGYLATQSYRLAFIMTIIIGIITLLQSLSFIEPSIGKRKAAPGEENIFLAQLEDSLSVIRNNLRIGSLILFAELFMAFCTCMFYYLQNYLKGIGYNEAMIGIIYSAAALSSAIMATQVHKLDRRIKEKGILLIIPLVTVGCMWGIALSSFHYLFFILLMITEGIIYVSTNDYINKMVPSENRATILSFGSMVFSFFMITLFPLVGLIGDTWSLVIAFEILGAIGIALVLFNSYLLLKKEKR